MAFHPFEVTIPHIAYACLGGFVVLFGMFSLFLRERLYIGEACWAFLFGIIIGPYGANIFNPRGWGNGDEDVTNTITLEFSRVVLAIGVFAIGVELPKAYMARHWKSLFFLLGPVMTFGWFVSAAFIFALVPGLNFLSSLAVAACLTPTDPILAAAVVGGKYADKHVPAHLRHLLAAESGCNDGAAFPFLYISLYLILDHNTGHAIRDWFLLLWLYQVVLGVVIGSCLGFGFRYLVKYCEKWDLIDRHSYVAQYVSLALFTIGVTCLLGSDDLLSTFACGTAFAWDGFFNRQTEESVFSSVIDLLFNIAAFVFVGAWMPFSSFSDAALTLSVWRLIVIAILVLLFRRLPIVCALYKWIPDIKTFREAVFSGHFGPIGIGGVFISTLAAQVLSEALDGASDQTILLSKTIQPIVAFMVLCSITIHGLSIPSFSLGRRVHSVSRTWSRHASVPDWTTQARHVRRGEDIVINRDDPAILNGLERGELTPQEKLSHVDSTSGVEGSVSSTSPAEEKRASGSAADSAQAQRHPPEDGEVLPEGEEPPDGTDVVSEWQEGPHRVIERRAGPGEEVEVEVIKNYGAPDAHSWLYRGSPDSTREHVHAYLSKLKKAIEDDVSGSKKRVESDVHQLENKAKDAVVEAADAVGAEGVAENVAGRSHEHSAEHTDNEHAIEDDDADEEEGWASDRSGGGDMQEGGSAASGLAAQLAARKRSKSPKTKPAVPRVGTVPPPRKGKRRNSFRRGLMGHVMHNSASSSIPSTTRAPPPPPIKTTREEADEGARERGRSLFGSPLPASPTTGSIRHHRVDSLRGLRSPVSREQSPARSVRFFDEAQPRSGYTTPRLSQSTPGTPPPGTPPPESEEEGTRDRVTFDIPESPSGKGR